MCIIGPFNHIFTQSCSAILTYLLAARAHKALKDELYDKSLDYDLLVPKNNFILAIKRIYTFSVIQK